MTTLNQRIIWRMPNGNLSTTLVMENARLRGESDDTFLTRMVARLRLEQNIGPEVKHFFKDKIDMRTVVQAHPEKLRHSLRMDINGNLSCDQTYESPQKKLKQTKAAIRAKMKAGQALNDTELDLLLGKDS